MISKHPNQDIWHGLDMFRSEAEQIIKSFGENLAMQKPPPIIYHYTSDVGLRGILETGQLWLTDILQLNDPSELNHGLSIGINVLKSMGADGSPKLKKFAQLLAALAQGKELIQESAYFFVCSFSSSGDDLGQWRAYADNGRGYALGFDTTALEHGFTKDGTTTHPYAAAFPISYKDAELAEIQRQIFEKIPADLISLSHGNLQNSPIASYQTNPLIRLLVDTLTNTIHAALFFKHEAYDNEKEYRFLRMYGVDGPPLGMKLRARPYSSIRYTEFDWRSAASNALKKIVVGPAADYKKAAQFATDCLRWFHPETVPITCSAIPYRAL
jgi:hypothetical protein